MSPVDDPVWLKKARSKGGHARKAKLTKKQLSAIGKKAAAARWNPKETK